MANAKEQFLKHVAINGWKLDSSSDKTRIVRPFDLELTSR